MGLKHFMLSIVCALLIGSQPAKGAFLDAYPDERLAELVQQIRDAIAQGAGIEESLARLVDALPSDIPAEIRGIVEHGIQTAAMVTSETLQCQLDVLKTRALNVLDMLEKIFSGDNAGLPPPLICTVSPDVIDLNREPSVWRIITISGYGFGEIGIGDEAVVPPISLITSSIQNPFTVNANRTTSYRVTFDLSSLEARKALFDSQNGRLRMRWDGAIVAGQSEIPITYWAPREELFIIPSAYHGHFVPPNANPSDDEGEFNNDDNRAKVWFSNNYTLENNKILMRTSFTAQEDGKDYTKVKYVYVTDISDIPSGYTIVNFSPSGTISARSPLIIPEDGSRDKKWTHRFTQNAIVESLDVWLSARNRRDVGNYTRFGFQTRVVQVRAKRKHPEWMEGVSAFQQLQQQYQQLEQQYRELEAGTRVDPQTH